MLSKNEFTTKLGKRIKGLRETKGINQEELAERAELYRTYVGHIENGRYSPSAYVIYKIAKSLGVGASDVLNF